MGIENTDTTIRDCCGEDIERVLSIWETSGAGRTPTDNVHDVKRAIAEPQLEFPLPRWTDASSGPSWAASTGGAAPYRGSP